MYRKFLAASVLTIGLATSAMASDGTSSNHPHWWPFGNEQSSGVDQSTTGSINGDRSGLDSLGNSGPAGPCASTTSGPDANAGLNVNDHYCGK